SSTAWCEDKSAAIGPSRSLGHAIDRLQPGTPARSPPFARQCRSDGKTPEREARNPILPKVPPADRRNAQARRDSEVHQARVRVKRNVRPGRRESRARAACCVRKMSSDEDEGQGRESRDPCATSREKRTAPCPPAPDRIRPLRVRPSRLLVAGPPESRRRIQKLQKSLRVVVALAVEPKQRRRRAW